MMTIRLYQWKNWLQHHPNPNYRALFRLLKRLRNLELPTPRIYNKLAYALCTTLRDGLELVQRSLIYTPAFKGRLAACGRQLNLYSGLPYISGPLHIEVGDDCRISGQTTFSGRTTSVAPKLLIGNNVGIGWQTTIAVATQVVIEDDVRIAGRSFLFGYPGHPMNETDRAKGLPDNDSQVGDIHLEKGVWLGTNVSVKGGVTIGRGTVVCTGSVVTKSLPPYVLAGGNPARVICSIREWQ